jgi:phosphoserine aminotransferase
MTSVTIKKRIHNFSAGPAALPLEVLEKAQLELLNFNNEGMSVMEMSHRSKTFMSVIESAEARCRRLLNIPTRWRKFTVFNGSNESILRRTCS